MRIPGAVRILIGALVAGALTATAFALLTPRRGGGTAYREVSMDAVMVVFAATSIAVIGAGFITWRFHNRVALLGGITAFLFVFGTLSLFSIGLVLVAAGIAMLIPTVRAMRTIHPELAAPSAVSGAALACSLLALLLVVMRPPIIQCLPNGVQTASPSWWGGELSGGGSGSVSPQGRADGVLEAGDTRFVYACEGGRLIEVAKESR